MSGCATLAEVRKRGKDFWSEFEFYLSDLIVGCVLDCVLVGLMAPTAILSKRARIGATGNPKVCTRSVELSLKGNFTHLITSTPSWGV